MLEIIKLSLYLLFMLLLVAYRDDPAGYNMACCLSKEMVLRDGVFRGRFYDLVVIPTPAISADWLSERYSYDGYVFLSKHAAVSGDLALTCHSTGNFSAAEFGGSPRRVAIPMPHLQKAYLQRLKRYQSLFPDFDVTIEATHHGPTDLDKPSIFIEIGTTEEQWTDIHLCQSVSGIIHDTLSSSSSSSSSSPPIPDESPVAICFGGTHYPAKFNEELLFGRHALGTVIPKHAIDSIDSDLFSHIMAQNSMATVALLDWKGMNSAHKHKVLNLLDDTELDVIKL